jgi:hypothetical protein
MVTMPQFIAAGKGMGPKRDSHRKIEDLADQDVLLAEKFRKVYINVCDKCEQSCGCMRTLDVSNTDSCVLCILQLEANYAHSSYYQGLLEYEPEALKVLLMTEVCLFVCVSMSVFPSVCHNIVVLPGVSLRLLI